MMLEFPRLRDLSQITELKFVFRGQKLELLLQVGRFDLRFPKKLTVIK